MNWYKIAKITDYQERNNVNKRIRLFKEIVAQLTYLTEYISQNPPDAQQKVQNFANSKEMSSFPQVQQMLIDAARVARDNYKKFSLIVAEARDILYNKVVEMESDRREFSNDFLPSKMKDSFDKG